MRLNRLDLIRYGRFKDEHLEFPWPRDGVPDVTVVFGPNEAGKTTAFEGFLEFLFGLKSGEHPYAFDFERADLLVGAELDLPGRGPSVLRRNGKRTNSLVDAQLRPVDEAQLATHLYGLNRDAYETRFSINEETLRNGGAAIAKADGDLGQLLHAGVSGLSGMASALDGMVARADKFHKKSGRGTELKTAKNRLTEIARELRNQRLTPEKERALKKACDNAEGEFRLADDALKAAKLRQAAGSAAATWHKTSEQIEEINEALRELPEGPNLPKGAPERIAALLAIIDEKTGQAEAAQVKIDDHRKVIDDNPEDAGAASLATEIERLEQMKFDDAKLLSRADTAESDLRDRKRRRDNFKARVDGALRQIVTDETTPEGLVLAPEAIEGLGRAAQDCIDAEVHLSNAEGAREKALKARGEEPQRPRDLSGLQAARDSYSKVADLTAAETVAREARRRAEESATSLPDTWRACVAKGLPALETLTACSTDMMNCNLQISGAEETLAELEGEYTQALEVRKMRESAPAAIDAGQTEETRIARETAWHTHRAALDAETADRFEQAMRRDDIARENFIAGSDARLQLSMACEAEARAKAKRDGAQQKLDALKTRRQEIWIRAAGFAEALGLPPDTEPSAFQARLRALTDAEEGAIDLEIAEKEREEALTRRAAAFDELRSAAEAADIVVGDGELAAQVNQALMLQDSVRRGWEAWKVRDKELASCEKEVATKNLERDDALGVLARLTLALPLANRSPESVKAALPALREIESCHGRFAELDRRVDAMERAIGTLRVVARRMAETLKLPFAAGDDPMEIVNTARARVEAAETAERARNAAKEGVKSETRLRDGAQKAARAAQEEIDGIFARQGGADLPASKRAEVLKRRDDLRVKGAELEKARERSRAGIEDELFEDELRRLPDPTRTSTLETSAEDASCARDDSRDSWRDARRQYDVAHAAADPAKLIAEQAMLRETLREGARQAAIRLIGVRVARDALKRLAEERRSTMLDDVRDAFVAITAPAWTSVDAWTHDQGERLVGTTADGEVVHVEKMSNGTKGQLYFALRLAGYRSFVREAGPLPMILDDIMETFDNTRASEALKLCGELGQEGQAIMFTHHEHLVDLAHQSIPGVAVVEMSR